MKTNIPYHLIHKDLTGEISLKESDKLHKWLEKDSQNEMLFDNTLDVWDNAQAYEPEISFSADAALAKFKQRISSEATAQEAKVVDITTQDTQIRKESKVISLGRRWNISAIAAGFALLIGSFAVYKSFIHNPILTESTSGDETLFVTLSDNSTILLHENSSITYNKRFNGEKRQVNLIGKAHFDIERNEKLPFEVSTNQAVVEVLGTEFTVDDRVADQIAVNVSEGLVRLQDVDSDQSVKIAVGNMAVLNTVNNRIETSKISDRVVSALKTGKVSFVAVSFEETVADLEALYNVNIEYEPTQFDGFSWTINNFDFAQSSVADIFPIINKALTDGTELTFETTDQVDFKVIRK